MGLRLINTDRYNVTLTGGTFDLFDRNCDRQNGLPTHLPINIAFDIDVDVTGSLGVNKALLARTFNSLAPGRRKFGFNLKLNYKMHFIYSFAHFTGKCA